MHTLVTIGYTGSNRCYLNVSIEEAIKRFCKTWNIDKKEFDEREYIIESFDFIDEFEAYDIWRI